MLKIEFQLYNSKGNFSIFLSFADFFVNIIFFKKYFRTTIDCQTVWIQVSPDILYVCDLGPNGLLRL